MAQRLEQSARNLDTGQLVAGLGPDFAFNFVKACANLDQPLGMYNAFRVLDTGLRTAFEGGKLVVIMEYPGSHRKITDNPVLLQALTTTDAVDTDLPAGIVQTLRHQSSEFVGNTMYILGESCLNLSGVSRLNAMRKLYVDMATKLAKIEYGATSDDSLLRFLDELTA